MRLDPYLHFNGNCAEAFNFYTELFGGSNLFLMTWGDSPMAAQMPAEKHGEVMHANVIVGNNHLMGSDAGAMYEKPQGFRVSAEVTSIEEAERIFNALREGGEVTMPLDETFWAIRFAMLTDRFGVPWMVNYPKPMTA